MFRITRMRVLSGLLSFVLLAGCGGGSNLRTLPQQSNPGHPLSQSEPGPQPVVDWNVVALHTSASAGLNPPLESRNLAIVQAAVYDAVIAITGGYHPYLFATPAARGASAAAAVATAAHDTLVGVYPAQQGALDATYTAYLTQIGLVSGLQRGIDVGHSAAMQTLALRSTDGSSTVVAYTPGTSPGDWQATPPLFKPALDPGWGKVTPFLMSSGAQFRPAAPPSLTSATYTADFNEIKSIGSATSVTRSADQTATAQFWAVTAPQLWNQAAQQLVVAKGFTIAQAAHAFATLNLVGADAFIAAWDAKYTYNQWRPVTAIRNAASTGNPGIVADATWTPLVVTPPFPDYVAGHATYAGAAETVLTELFGSSPGTFHITSAASGLTHQYSSFQQVADETVNARVWGGIHWRTSCTVGRSVGRLVAAYDLKHGLQPQP